MRPEPPGGVYLDLERRHGAPNYDPLPVVVAAAQGVWVTDVAGRRYMDLLSAYSALNFGHRHPALVQAARDQLDRLTLTSRAFHNDRLGPFCAALADLCGMEAVLPMNTGAEAVETAIKVARKWGYERRDVSPGQAEVVVCDGNFHGRTTTIVSASTDPLARDGFGPFTPGFTVVPYGDADALRAAIGPDTVAFLVEPIQGERGVILPPQGYLREVRKICTDAAVLLVADEVQCGLGRTGSTFACDHEGVRPDVYVLGKALGGGLLPVSAVVSSHEVLDVLGPGSHGSTFGGNPLAAAVGLRVIELLRTGEYQERSAELGSWMLERLHAAGLGQVAAIRGRGLWAGIDVVEAAGSARAVCERLLGEGLLCKETHGRTMRIAPPLTITRDELDWALERLARVLS